MTKPTLPQGTRDFGPETVRKRNYILDIIRNVFELYGFQPLETPAMENLETLMGKYGEEGDKLIFKILNNGLDNSAKEKQTREGFEKVLEGKNTKLVTERALKYDLTIPFARYVAMNHGQLAFPFKRYQVQPVWRADRPQKGRYREFFQCDADVVGSSSLLNELELFNIYSDVFEKLAIKVDIKINSRKILAALAEHCGDSKKLTDITTAIDKLDKIGLDKVMEELVRKGLEENQINTIRQYLLIDGDNTQKIKALRELLGQETDGIAELEYMVSAVRASSPLQIDLTLARGLNYYTGIIYEVKARDIEIGSIGGGGRYDDLTGLFGVPDIPGVGISFGVDRIYDVMEELNLFPLDLQVSTQVLFFNLGEKESKSAYTLLQGLRKKGIRGELFHETTKFDKQFKYAEKKNIPNIIIIGEKELNEKTCTIKKLASGEQQTIPVAELDNYTF